MSIQLQKQQLRTSIKSIIKCFPFDSIISSSSSLTQRLFNLPELNSTSKNISIYLPLPIGEINTIEFINRFMKERGDNSLCYIPKVYGKKSTDMTMYYLSEKDLVKSPTPLSSAFLENVNFPLNSWGIPEPDLEQVLQQQQVTSTTDLKIPSDIDIVIVPGVGFDLKGMRLGHGKGYYDCFINKLTQKRKEIGLASPLLIGICFDEQIVTDLPSEPHDIPLNILVTPTREFRFQ